MAELSFRRLRCRFVTEGNEVERLLYIRPFHLEHTDEKGRTLSVAGVPVFLQPPDTVLEGLFAGCGAVDRVFTHPRQTTALVVFAEASGCQKALITAKEGHVMQLTLPPPDRPCGLRGWVEEHKAVFPGNEVLKEKLDAWTVAYEAEEARRKAETSADEGWTVVERKPGRKKSKGDGISVGAVALEAAQERAQKTAKKQQQDLDFYRFMRKEEHLRNLVQLKRKFHEDVARVKEMRLQRKFKPY
eukprot:jgi/Botrbrau1/15352/Bobra.0289s0007.1